MTPLTPSYAHVVLPCSIWLFHADAILPSPRLFYANTEGITRAAGLFLIPSIAINALGQMGGR